MSIIVRLATKADSEDCNALHNRAYGNSRSLDQWNWTFQNKLFPELELAFIVAEDGGKIIGTQALIPIQMIDKDGIYWSAKSEETLVDVNYRGQGLFEKMYSKAFEVSKMYNFQSIWGFTPARKAFLGVGFEILMDTSQLFKPLRLKCVNVLLNNDHNNSGLFGLKKIFKKILFLLIGAFSNIYSNVRQFLSTLNKSRIKTIKLKDLSSAPAQAKNLIIDFISQWGGATIYRDQQYLKWRIFDNPFIKSNMTGAYIDGELVGYCAFAIGDNEMGYIIDIIAVEPKDSKVTSRNVVHKLLSTASSRLSDMGACGIRGWKITNHKFDKLVAEEAKKLGYININRGTAVVLHKSYETNCHRKTIEFKNWSVSRIYTEGRNG